MATEKRLIDANVAKEMIVNHANEFSDVLNRREKALLIGGGTSCIDKCPTVDAVEVVRCKDCDYNLRDDDRTPRCTYWHEDVSVNGFCHHGKMREEEDDDEDD